MKKTLRIASLLALVAVVAVAVFAFSACETGKDENKLYVGMECGYIPFNFTQPNDANGAVKISNAPGYANGYDVMIAKRIAQSLGKELVIVKYEWNALVNAVKVGTLDFIIAGMSPTAERLQSIDFSNAYYESQLVIVVRKDGNFANATSLAELRGANIVAQLGTFHDVALENQAASYGINRGTPMETFPLMTAALVAGTIDGYVAEEPGAIADCATGDGLKYVPLVNNQTGFTVSAEDVQIAVGLIKNSPIKAQVNDALAQISAEERQQMMETAIGLASSNVK
ncbi:MAG: transporter substrate-binding domain-containing protein [Candidatus Fimimonas sp.]